MVARARQEWSDRPTHDDGNIYGLTFEPFAIPQGGRYRFRMGFELDSGERLYANRVPEVRFRP
jgi:hypothetical protein